MHGDTGQNRVMPYAGLRAALVCLALWLGFAGPAAGHQLRLAYLQLNETGAETYDVLWKLAARGDSRRLALDLNLPAGCSELAEPRGLIEGGAYSARWGIRCAGGLAGGRIRIGGLAETGADALVRIEYRDGSHQAARLTAAEPAFVVAVAPGAVEVAFTYLKLGVEHILLGIDHLLFVLALLLIVTGTRRLILTITAFTLAHSLTLAAATLDIVRIPIPPVEAVIALSIVFVASEILRTRKPSSIGGEGLGEGASLTARAPWLVAFVFGLLHGFGFASALAEVGLPQMRIPVALLFFNIGVELGQLLFITSVLALIAGFRRLRWAPPPWFAAVPAYAIGGIAMFWVIERVGTF